MYFTPESLLSSTAREQCIRKLKALPTTVEKDAKTSAAVLVPLCVVNNEVCLLYTLRSTNLSSHKGQVSFPGGKVDKDESEFETAIRETEEEIGVLPHQIDIWTKMHRVIGLKPSVVITPVVGELKDVDLNKLQPNENEVAEIFTVPMSVLCDKKNHASYLYNGYSTPVFICGKHKVWGITGAITYFFLECFLPPDVFQGDFVRKVYQLEELLPSKL